MTESSYPLKMPNSVKTAATRLAKADGVSLNQFIAVAVAEKVGAMEAAAEFLACRSAGAKPTDLARTLRRARNVEPEVGDTKPPARRARS